LKEIHKEMSVEAVQKLMDDTVDAIEYQNVSVADRILARLDICHELLMALSPGNR
jgi:hypothetical protein